ncbi:MAG: hypothetical protein JW802_06515 [Campylobacterales bacterium]|nr:hypothetical protein [Campylobacterales bacterium]MBN2832422.1 hypothetical protein [Campylobacterales bacterium]
MKKIILALMVMVSVSSAVVFDNLTHLGGGFYTYTTSNGDIFCAKKTTVNISQPNPHSNYPYSIEYNTNTGKFTENTGPSTIVWNAQSYPSSTCASCPSGQTRNENGECSTPLPNDSPFCDPYLKRYATTSGQCVDCSQSDNVNAVASCACDAVGSTYTGLKMDILETVTNGSFTFTKNTTKCDNGKYIPVYTEKTPLPTSPDNNTTVPTTPADNNTTTPTTPDNNTTTPTTPDINVNGGFSASDSLTLKQIEQNTKEGNVKLDKFIQDLNTTNEILKESKTNLDLIRTSTTGSYTKLQDIATYTSQSSAKLGQIYDFLVSNANGSGNGTGTSDSNGTAGVGDRNTTGSSDGNGTSIDLNETNKILNDIRKQFDTNSSFKTPDVNESSFELSDLLPENSWFETNKLNLKMNNYSGGCYCETAQFQIADKTFVFPSPEFLAMVPFNVISNLLMAFVYLLGLRQFLKD